MNLQNQLYFHSSKDSLSMKKIKVCVYMYVCVYKPTKWVSLMTLKIMSNSETNKTPTRSPSCGS